MTARLDDSISNCTSPVLCALVSYHVCTGRVARRPAAVSPRTHPTLFAGTPAQGRAAHRWADTIRAERGAFPNGYDNDALTPRQRRALARRASRPV